MTTFTLKIIALVVMIIDHSALLITRLLGKWVIYFPLRIVGRIAFPIYVFLVAEGCRHTKNIKKYMGRLLLFALISEIPFDYKRAADLGEFTILEFGYQNVFFTLFLGVLSVYLFTLIKEKCANKGIRAVMALGCVFACGFIAEFFRTDYKFSGVAVVFLAYIAPEVFTNIKSLKLRKILGIIIGILILYTPVNISAVFMFAGAMVSIIPMLLYNGEKGPSLKWGFYLAYPIHLFVIGMLIHVLII